MGTVPCVGEEGTGGIVADGCEDQGDDETNERI